MERKKINSAKNLSEETLNSLLEELNQVANGPELTGAGELDNEATEEKEPTEDTLEKDNTDAFPAEEHEQTEDVEEVVVESDQVAAGPEIEDGEKKLENEATEEKEPTEDALEKENTDVYCDASHNQTEDVEEVVVESSKYTDEQLYKLLEAKGFKKSETNLRIVKEGLDSGRYAITEDGLETEPTVKAAEDAGVASDVPAEDAEATVDEVQEVIDTEVADDEAVKDTDDSISESMKRLFSLIDTINENAQVAAGPEVEDGEKKLDNEATEEKEPSQDSLEKDNTDVFPAEEHEQAEDVEEVVVESDQVAAGPEIEDGEKKLENEATEEKEPSQDSLEKDNTDVYCDVCHNQTEDVKEVVVETQVDNRGVRQVGRKVNPEFVGKTTTADGKTTYQFRGKDYGEDEAAAKAAQDKFNIKHGNKHVVKESDQVAAGPEVEDGEKKLENEATLEKEPTEAALEKDNKDVYTNMTHDQVEDVVDVVIEALSSCKRDGIVLSNKNIKKRATELFEELGVEIGDSVKNQYDADADIESSEMNGSDTAFDEVEEIKDEEHFDGPTAEKMQESIKYNSLKEACMLDESYFKSSTYTIQTADEKKEKLTEQVALLAAREAMDPMYDELLKQALYCQRLQEALQNKYSATALNRVSTIISD